MLAWLAPILVLGLVVFVHELGHFIAAKLTGVYAPRFSLGWGKAIWRWRPKGSETEYVISALPIGGYVRMASRDDEAMAAIEGGGETITAGAEDDPRWDPEAMIPHGPKPVPANRWFESKPALARVFILIAGVTMNIILTFTIASSMIAWKGKQIIPAVIDSVVADLPAARAGIQRGDSVVAVSGTPIKDWGDFVLAVRSRAGERLRIDVVRGTERRSFDLTPQAFTDTSPFSGNPERVGKVGVTPSPHFLHEDVSFAGALALGAQTTWAMGDSVIMVVGRLVRGSQSVKTLGGPIAIARASVATARSGLESLLGLIAFLSVNLAVLNLLPIPILDGGQILVTLAEGVRGKAFSLKTRENLMKTGLAAIMLLFAVVMFNDIKALIGSWFK